MGLYGMGELTSLVTLCEPGDVQRLSASRKAVRMAGIDIGVHRSDRRSRVGKRNRQGSPHLRWALYEAALAACRPSSPDHTDYLALKARDRQPHARVTDDRAQARPAQFPRPAPTRPSRPGTRPQPLTRTTLSSASAHRSTMTSTLPASSRSFRGSRPRAAAHQRPSGRSHSTRTDPSTITSPTQTRSRTQISPGIHGAVQHPDYHDRSPPEPLTPGPVQISGSTRRVDSLGGRPPGKAKTRLDAGRRFADRRATMRLCRPGALNRRVWKRSSSLWVPTELSRQGQLGARNRARRLVFATLARSRGTYETIVHLVESIGLFRLRCSDGHCLKIWPSPTGSPFTRTMLIGWSAI
jgi:hypothetical protein